MLITRFLNHTLFGRLAKMVTPGVFFCRVPIPTGQITTMLSIPQQTPSPSLATQLQETLDETPTKEAEAMPSGGLNSGSHKTQANGRIKYGTATTLVELYREQIEQRLLAGQKPAEIGRWLSVEAATQGERIRPQLLSGYVHNLKRGWKKSGGHRKEGAALLAASTAKPATETEQPLPSGMGAMVHLQRAMHEIQSCVAELRKIEEERDSLRDVAGKLTELRKLLGER